MIFQRGMKLHQIQIKICQKIWQKMKKSLVQFAYKLIPGTQKTDFMYPISHYMIKFFYDPRKKPRLLR